MSSFDELGKALRWSARTQIFMLWAYLDDSGVHGRGNGPLLRYALGGGVASNAVWQDLRQQWQSRLDDASNPTKVWFHYTDWKGAYLGYAKEGEQFYGWSKQQLLNLLSDLTRLVAKREVHYLCASVRAVQSKRAVRHSYMKVTTNVINRAQQIAERADPAENEISFMFSEQAELAGSNIQKYWTELRKLNGFGGRCDRAYCVIGDPRKEPLLQAADLIANEMTTSRYIQATWGPKFHMPEVTKVMEQLRRQPPWHHMTEYHEDDEKGPNVELANFFGARFPVHSKA